MKGKMDRQYFSTPLALKAVRIAGGFWYGLQETVRMAVIPYQWEALNDRVPGAEPSYCIHNFRAAARLLREKRAQGADDSRPGFTDRGLRVLPEDLENPEPDTFYGFVFQDSDLYKWIEAAAYSLTRRPDPVLERTVDEAVELICAAQDESGYLDTYYIINGMDRIFTNLRDHHELYCLGHLAEAAAAYYEATGKDRLLRAACRFADCAAEWFGCGPGKCKGYPGHELAEMGLARLFEVTGEEKYLSLSRFFLDQRGIQPCYFEEESRRRAEWEGRPYKPDTNPAYHQAHMPVREQSEAVGHAVRAGYLCAGMADMARLSGDEGMYAACRRLWESIVREKLYITGGIGGTHIGEAFSYPFDLPNDTAYSETCAAISLVFFARRMLELAPCGEYADVMELALYNTIPAGMALDGRSFFYVNPLEVVPSACRADQRLSHVDPVRQKWLGCACCPPNLARLIGSVQSYAYTENTDTLWVHLYVGGEVIKRVGKADLRLEIESRFPWEGQVRVSVRADKPVRCTLAFRLPGWCETPSVSAPEGTEALSRDGYRYLTGIWKAGDTVVLDFPMEARLVMADERVREDLGKAALLRGPIVYCVEEVDNGPALYLCRIDPGQADRIKTVPTKICGKEMLAMDVPGFRTVAAGGPLYRKYRPEKMAGTMLRFIPYFAWANRGEGEMQVWTRI